jgi:hypothetical protein
MDRILIAEFPAFGVSSDTANQVWVQGATDTRQLPGIYGLTYVQEQKIDLSGYVQSDLTVGFRRSFEQVGGVDQIFWDVFNVKSDYTLETLIVSSVPFTDSQLASTLIVSPGFTPYPLLGADWGNFNRTHIIHGHFMAHMPNTTIASSDFASSGNATLLSVTDNDFSSLEPTAADCLYCYRIISVPEAGGTGGRAGVTQVSLPPKRIILDAFTVEEPDLEYMMRLKRSYELANQV